MRDAYVAAGFWFGVLVAAVGAVIIFVWVGLALGAGRVANRRGYPRAAGLAVGVLTGPLAIAGFALLPSRRRAPRGARQTVNIATQRANVAVVRRTLEWDQDVLDEHMAWHFQSPYREGARHFEGKHAYTTAWLDLRRAATRDTFRQRAAAIWPLGDDLVVAHVEVAMTVDDMPRQGSSVVVYRVADGAVVEGFDIPSASLFGEAERRL
jgi:hypothetical protein